MRCWRSLVDHGSRAPVTRDEGYVALQAWLVGQLNPRTPHAADVFAQDRECLYDAFLSVLIGTGLGFIDYDDIRFHHGLYAFDFFVGDVHAPPRRGGAELRPETWTRLMVAVMRLPVGPDPGILPGSGP